MIPAQPAVPFAVRGDRSSAAQLFLGVSIVAALALILTTWLQMRAGTVMAALPATNSYDTSQPTEVVAPGSVLLGVQIAALILVNALQFLTMFVIAVWVHRAYSNLGHLGARTTYTPFAAAAYVVVPLANLIVPHTVFAEIWRGSDPSGVRSLKRLPSRPIELVSKWWYLFIAYAVTSNVAGALLMRRGADPHAVHLALIVAGAAGIVAALVGIDMIRLVDTRQTIRRSGQPTRLPVAPPTAQPQPVSQARPQPQPASGWREILLPVVTAVEREIQEEVEEAGSLSAPLELDDELTTVPHDLAPPRPRLTSALLLITAVCAFLQALGALTNLKESEMPRLAVFYLLLFPFTLPLYALSAAVAVAFSLWVGRAYGNLRAYMTPPRSHLEASSDFVRRGGDPEVLGELWAVTMSRSATTSGELVERWARTWRLTKIFAVVSVAGLFFLPARLMLVILAAFFALAGWSALLARTLVREVSATQVTRLAELAARQARSSALPASPEPPALPQ